jgi:hypothetical protein
VGAVASGPVQVALEAPLGVGETVRRSGPRLVRDAFGPLAMFFAGWKLVSLGAGIAAAVTFGVVVYAHERRAGRPAAIVRLSLVLVMIRATVGIASGSGRAYLATEIGIDALLATTVLGSLATRRPFASWFARDVYPFPPEVLGSPAFDHAMRVITWVWGGYYVVRGLVRLAALLTLGTDSYALVVALSDAPFLIALLAWSAHYALRTFRDSEELGPLLAAAEASS